MQQILSSAKLLVEVVREWRNVVKATENCSQHSRSTVGHRSSSVRAYKRTSDEQQQQLSKIVHRDRGNSFGKKKVKKDENEGGVKNTEIEIEAGNIKISVKKC